VFCLDLCSSLHQKKKNIIIHLFLNENSLYDDLHTIILVCYLLFYSLIFIPSKKEKNVFKNKIEGLLNTREGAGIIGALVP